MLWQTRTPKAPLHSWPWANCPMQRIHVDYAEIEIYQVLVIIDIHSKWTEAIPLRTATAATTIEALRRFFASLGCWKKSSLTMGGNRICQKNGIKKYVHIPAYHPVSNGDTERAVQVVKQAGKKVGMALTLSIRLARFLLMYRTTPHSTAKGDQMNCFFIDI